MSPKHLPAWRPALQWAASDVTENLKIGGSDSFDWLLHLFLLLES